MPVVYMARKQGGLNGNQKHADTYENNNKQQGSRTGDSQEKLQVQ